MRGLNISYDDGVNRGTSRTLDRQTDRVKQKGEKVVARIAL